MNHIAQMYANLIRSFEAMSGAAAYGKLKFGPFELSSRERVLRRDGVVLPLGDRALDILIYLAERPGEVVAKRELMDHVWSDVTVEEGSLRVHVAAIRKALGDGQSGNRYIANIKGRGYSFVGTVVSLAGSTESGNDRSGQPGRLPAQPRRMIGRDPVISEVSDKLRDERFLTLLGPGGIGKTTIASAVGHAAVEEFGGEVYLVDLKSLTDPRHVAGAIATSLGFALKSKDPGLELVDLVRSRKLLIILDSCEHVIEAVASVAEQLYQETEQVYLLTTSRELLKVKGEHCCRVRAYHSFSREVEASNTPTIRRLIPSCQLSRIAPRWSAGSRMRQVMAHRDPSSPTPMPTILRYGIAVLSVAIAIRLDFFLLRHFEVKLTPFLFAVAATVWYAGTGPGVLAIVLSVLSLNYFFLHSFFSFSPISYADLVYLTFCTFCALGVGWVSAVRRRTEQELRQAHGELDAKISRGRAQAPITMQCLDGQTR
jgi:DNA-binding winged helix-turn-helix (wHTH) protein